MTAFRAAVAGTAAIALLFALALQASHAADEAPPTNMPKLPDLGSPSTAVMPPIGDISGAGKSVGGLSPDRVVRSLKGAQASVDAPLRGRLEQDLYAKFSRSVVLIVTPDALGSGTVIDKDGTILTNWHVVEGQKTVGVIFKPQVADARVYESDAVEAKVLRIDQIADLALIKVAAIPQDVKIVALGDPAKLKVGADVHAIGHPLGEIWSYTKGIVSQIRPNYEWTIKEEGIAHRADVVQTQTPINPGNSGGPLMNDAGELVGIASFGSGEGAQINFAIASSEVRRFLGATGDRLAPAAPVASKATAKECEFVKLETRRTKDNDGTVQVLDTDCNGKGDAWLIVYDDKSKPILLSADSDGNGKADTIYVDKNGDLKFEYVVYDTNEDGKADLVGYDLDDNLEPRRVELVKR